MNVVIFSAYAVNCPHFETELELASTHADAGDHVTLLTCGSELEACDPNPYHDVQRCAKCIGRRDAGLALLPPSVEVRPFLELTPQDRRDLDQVPTRFDTHDQLKSYRVGGFDIGYAALSSLISRMRDPRVSLTTHAALLRAFLRSAWTVHRSMMRLLDAHQVDRVYVFNGRLAVVRAVLRACQEKGVDCYTHERGRDPNLYILLENTSIHDIETVDRLIRETWDAAAGDPARETTARQWYEDRAHGGGDMSFVGGQHTERLPANWNPEKRNIALFVSSEDEFAAVGDAWKNPLYDTQTVALAAIVNALRDDPGDIHLYIRTHPNLSVVDNAQTREIGTLNTKFSTVIPPADPVDTYELMRRSSSVVSFGSTAGIEAVYWGTPSILAGVSFYRHLGVTYNPQSHDELIQLLHADLQPKPIDATLAFGYFWPTFGIPFKHFTPDGYFSGRFMGVRIKPSPAAQARIAFLRITHPQRFVRHVKRGVTKRWRFIRNRMRRPV
ncbi:MAG: capsular polysaccharide export protein, LipB/KpsS family [Planctomycetota bacterium]|jgi:hypothetical protein